MTTTKMNVIECDNPGCEVRYIEDEIEPIPGYTFDGGNKRAKAYIGAWHHPGGGQGIPSFYACQTECILPALAARLREDWDR